VRTASVAARCSQDTPRPRSAEMRSCFSEKSSSPWVVGAGLTWYAACLPGDSIDRTTHLTGEYTRLEDELETQKINLKDINDFLSNELKAKETYCNELEKSLLDLEQTGEAEKAKFESEKTRMLEEFREREHDLQVRVRAR
jgi:hypothetical protein